MDIKKYNELLEIINSEMFEIPQVLVEDYNKGLCRFNTARFLMQLEKYEEALKLLLTVNKDDFEEVELWVCSLNCIGVCYWNSLNDAEKALKYFRKGDELAASIDDQFSFTPRGEFWWNILYALKTLGREEELKEEINKKIEIYNKSSKEFQSNSYLFNAYYFMAQNEEDINTALEYLYNAGKYFPLDQCEKEEFKTQWENRGEIPTDAYKKIRDILRTTVVWDI